MIALRHQLRVLQRQAGRPRWQTADRIILAAISRALARSNWSSLIPSPETVLRWHRELVRRKCVSQTLEPARSLSIGPVARRA